MTKKSAACVTVVACDRITSRTTNYEYNMKSEECIIPSTIAVDGEECANEK